jgi:hypothetical protein
MLILPCTNYCNKGTLTYLLQAMAKDDYGSFGWVVGTNHEVMGLRRYRARLTKCSPTEPKDTVVCPFFCS